MASNHGIGQVHVLNLGLELASLLLGNPATKDHRDLLWLPDRSICVEQAVTEIIQGRAAAEDQVVAEFGLREEQPVSATRFLTLSRREEGCEVCQPFLAASDQISRNEQVGEAIGCSAFQEGISELLEFDAILAQAVGQPVVLIEANTGGERKVGADANEHSPPAPVVDVKIVLNDSALSDLKMPSVRDLIANRNHDARWLTRFNDDYDRVWLGEFKVLIVSIQE